MKSWSSPAVSYFDTNIGDDHHFFIEDTGELAQIPGEQVELTRLPLPPVGAKISRVDVIVRFER